MIMSLVPGVEKILSLNETMQNVSFSGTTSNLFLSSQVKVQRTEGRKSKNLNLFCFNSRSFLLLLATTLHLY